jgi:hypothetical protein
MPHGLARPPERAEIYADAAALSESLPLESDAAAVPATIRGGRERGLIVHKRLEEVLTGETPDQLEMLETRARALLAQLGVTEAARSEDGPDAPELAATVLRALAIPEISACRSRLIPELTVFSVQSYADGATYTGGVVDALAHHADGSIALIIDWKNGRGSQSPANRALSRPSPRLPRCHERFRGPPCFRHDGPVGSRQTSLSAHRQRGLINQQHRDDFLGSFCRVVNNVL